MGGLAMERNLVRCWDIAIATPEAPDTAFTSRDTQIVSDLYQCQMAKHSYYPGYFLRIQWLVMNT